MNGNHTENALWESISEQYRSVYENHPDAVYVVDMDGNYRYCNPAVFRQSGYSPEEVLGLPAGRLFTVSEDQERVINHYKQAMQGVPQETTITATNKLGQTVHLQLSIVPAFVDGNVVAVHAFSKDISQLVRTQQELKKNQPSLLNAQSIAKFGTWTYDVLSQRLEWSDSMKLIHGLPTNCEPIPLESYEAPHAQAIAKVGNFTWGLVTDEVHYSDEVRRIYGVQSNVNLVSVLLDRTHPDDWHKLFRAIEFVMREEHVLHDVECRLLFEDGTVRYVHIHGKKTFNDRGEATTLFGTVQDITERKKTEEAIHRSEKLAVVGELAAGVAHEIRNPLTTLKGFIQLMNLTDLSIEKQQQYCDVMLDELERIEFITNELLTLAKPQVSEPGNRLIISELLKFVSLLEPEALLHNVSMVFDVCSEDIVVKGETGKLKQVFVNIIKNAIEAMPHGGILKINVTKKMNGFLSGFPTLVSGQPRSGCQESGSRFTPLKKREQDLG